MINSIQHFCTEGVKNLETVMADYSDDMTKTAEMVQGAPKRVTDLGLSIIAGEWENYDELLRKRTSAMLNLFTGIMIPASNPVFIIQ